MRAPSEMRSRISPVCCHHDHRAAHRDEQDPADDESAAHSHREEQHDEHDHDRHPQVQNKFVDRLGHGIRLEGDLVQLHPERDLRAELADAPLDSRAHRDHVAAADRGDADADGALAVIAKRSGWRINVVAADGRDVFQINELAAAITRSADEQILEISTPVHSPVGLIVIASGPTSTAPLWTTRFCSRRPQKLPRGGSPAGPCGRGRARCR